MIRYKLTEIANRCSELTDKEFRVQAKLSSNGIWIETATRDRSDMNCWHVSWSDLDIIAATDICTQIGRTLKVLQNRTEKGNQV